MASFLFPLGRVKFRSLVARGLLIANLVSPTLLWAADLQSFDFGDSVFAVQLKNGAVLKMWLLQKHLLKKHWVLEDAANSYLWVLQK